MNLDEVYTITEASEIWGISDSNIRNAITKFGRFEAQKADGTIKQSGSTWLISRQAMEEVFGDKKSKPNHIRLDYKRLFFVNLVNAASYEVRSAIGRIITIFKKDKDMLRSFSIDLSIIKNYFFTMYEQEWKRIEINEQLDSIMEISIDKDIVQDTYLVELFNDNEDDMYYIACNQIGIIYEALTTKGDYGFYKELIQNLSDKRFIPEHLR